MQVKENDEGSSIPVFTPEELFRIQEELHPWRWKEIGRSVPINQQWEILITKSERDGFHTTKAKALDIATFLIQTGSVYVYSGRDEDHEGAGFKIVPRNTTQENPYDTLMSPLNTAIKTGSADIDMYIQEVRESISNLEERLDRLEQTKRDIQQRVGSIPGHVLAGENIQKLGKEFEVLYTEAMK